MLRGFHSTTSWENLACGESTLACRLRASSTRSARRGRTPHLARCATVQSSIRPYGSTKQKGHHLGVLLSCGSRRSAIHARLPLTSELDALCAAWANSAPCALRYGAEFGSTLRVDKTKRTPSWCPFRFGDSWENRTPVSALRGPCLSRLTNEPYHLRIIFYHRILHLSTPFLFFLHFL